VVVGSSVAERSPRIRFVVNHLRLGGAERHLVDLVRGGTRAGRFEAEVVCLKERGPLASELDQAGVPVRGPWLRYRFDGRALRELMRAGRRWPADVLYTHHGANELALAQVSKAAFGTPTVAAVHVTPQRATGRHFSRTQRWLLRRTTVVVAIAPSQREHLIVEAALEPRKTVAIVNGVDHTRFHPEASAEVGAPSTIGVVASLLPEKGHAILIEAMRRVVSANNDARLLVVGQGPCEAALREQTRVLGLASHVCFLGPRTDVETILPKLAAFALPALPGGQTVPLAVLEAMACSIPVVVTRVGSMADMVRDGCEGFVVSAGDPRALADRLSLLLTDRARAQDMGKAGRARVVADFTLDRMVDEYSRLFESLPRKARVG
jgi:glycosyltransferase involved in cell wall biosynthesis